MTLIQADRASAVYRSLVQGVQLPVQGGVHSMIETKQARTGGSRGSRSAVLKISVAVAGAVLLVIGLTIGATLNSHHAQIAAQQARLRALQQSLTMARAESATAKTKMEASQAQASAA